MPSYYGTIPAIPAVSGGTTRGTQTGGDATTLDRAPAWVPPQFHDEWNRNHPQIGTHGGLPLFTANRETTWTAGDGSIFVAPNGDKASDILANVTRSQWSDYINTFAPLEQRLMNETTYNNPNILPKALDEGTSAINTQFNVAQGMEQRNMQRYGVHADARQLGNMAQVENLGRTAAIVGAANNIRQRLSDRNLSIASGGIPNAARNYGGANGGDSGK